ncbi:MAG: response regulator, partial [Methylobacterium sp.]|nr:response regulator [Methylobacterium sp.]
VMDGMTLLRTLKQDPRYAHIPVIMQTAAAAPDQVREGLNAGCYYYLTKPYKSTALTSIVHAALADLRLERLLADALASTPPVPATPNADYAFSTLEEARRLAALLAAQCPDPATVALGLSELLINAVEHGNLGITYAEKTLFKREDRWEEEIARRLGLPEYHTKKASASFSRDDMQISFTITDQGKGFEWQNYLDFDPQRAFDPNGRGIAIAGKLSFASLEYQGCGNRVVATVKLR